jgi:hypothetical protein
MFIRHYRAYEGAERIKAFLFTLESNRTATQLKGVCFDFRAVADVTLRDSDRSYTAFLQGKLANYSHDTDSIVLVQIFDPENLAINEIIVERGQRQTTANIKIGSLARVYNVPDALKALGLPADYCIEYPPEK